jgi:hypothetical protein
LKATLVTPIVAFFFVIDRFVIDRAILLKINAVLAELSG